MKLKWNLLPFLVCLSLLVLTACAGSAPSPTATAEATLPPPTPAPTTTPAPTAVPATAIPKPTLAAPTAVPEVKPTEPTGLYLVSSYSYTDTSHNFHVVGEVKNADKKALDSMELTIEIRDKAGSSLLKDSAGKSVDSLTFSPLISTLAPGESSPFTYYLSSDAGTPDKYYVTVTGQNTAQVTRPKVEVTNDQMKPLNGGGFLVTGDLVNKSDFDIEIHDLVGALLDKNKHVVSADYSFNYSVFLAAAGDKAGLDRTPFAIALEDSGGSPSLWSTYVNAEEATSSDHYPMVVELANPFFDENAVFHLVGTVTNKSKDTVTTTLVAGLYADDGKVLDATADSSPVNLAPGETLPFDLTTFDNVNSNPDEAKRLKNYTVQVDDYSTFKSSFDTLALKSSNEKVTKDTNSWSVTGQVANTSGKVLSDETVLVGVYDASGKLVASNWTTLYPSGDSIAAGDVISYKIDVTLKPGVDVTGFTYKVQVKGTVK